MKTHETNLQNLLNFKGWCYLSTIFRNNIIYEISDREGVVHLKYRGMEWFIWDLCNLTEINTIYTVSGGNISDICEFTEIKHFT